MNILTLTTLFPNKVQYRHGIFVENRLRHLRRQYPHIALTVIAPVPYFPLKAKWAGAYNQYAQVPEVEERFGVTVYHPRYFVLPKIGMHITPYFLYLAMKKTLLKLTKSGQKFDLIDCHYFYPDGVAATKLANELQLPITVTARGSDITLLPKFPKVRSKISKVLRTLSAGIGVCNALVDEMKAIEPQHKPLHTIRNGVDLALFSPPTNREKLRKKLSINRFTLLMVGNLVSLKGHKLVIEALTHLPDVTLIIIGEGVLEHELKALSLRLSLQERITFVGTLKQTELPSYYGAVDCLVLASSREGWPNVLLESMACGTPVVATKVWGTPEVVCKPEAGVLVERSVSDITKGIQTQMKHPLDRQTTREYAENYSWQASSEALARLYSQLINSSESNLND